MFFTGIGKKAKIIVQTCMFLDLAWIWFWFGINRLLIGLSGKKRWGLHSVQKEMRLGCEEKRGDRKEWIPDMDSQVMGLFSSALYWPDGLGRPYCFTTIKPLIVLSPNRPAKRWGTLPVALALVLTLTPTRRVWSIQRNPTPAPLNSMQACCQNRNAKI